MWIFQHKELTVLFVISAALFVPYYMWLRSDWIKIESLKNVFIFFALWLGLITIEFLIFGANSFIETDTDSRNITFLYYLARLHDGGQFAHQIAGGQDSGIILPGTQFFVPEKILLKTFDPWLVIWMHKLMVGALAFWGAYLLARGVNENVDRFTAFAAASIFPVSHEYLGSYSIEFGTGFAAIPIAVYASVFCVNRKSFPAWVMAAGIILALAQPMKVFPAALVAVAGALFLYDRRSIGKTLAAFVFFIVLSVLNWHEVLYGIVVLVGQTARAFGAAMDAADVTSAMATVLSHFYGNWLINGLLAASVILLIVRRDRLWFGALGVLFLYSVAYIFAESFPWQTIGLSFINRVEHAYMWLALPVLAVPIAAKAACAPKGMEAPGGYKGRKYPAATVLFAVSLCVLTWNKSLTLARWTAFGGQSTSFGFSELEKPQWKGDQNFRAVTLFEIPPPNITASYYGIDSFDGALLLNSKPWNDYWASIKGQPAATRRIATRSNLDWSHWNGETYAIGEELRFDLLRIANVKYIISALPLAAEPLKAILTSDREDWAKTRPDFFSNRVDYFKYRFNRIFDPGRLFVYALPDPLPRIFAATGIEAAASDLDAPALHDLVAAHALDRRAVMSSDLVGAFRGLGELAVTSFSKVVDGYDVTVDAPQGGVLMVNNTYLPFWRATADGRTLDIVPANAIHMAIAIPKGVKRIKIRYHRPTLKEKLASVFN